MENRPNWALLARYLAGTCSSNEERRVKAWIRADPSRRQLIEELRSIWDAAKGTSRRSKMEVDVEAGWQEVRSGMEASDPASLEADPPRESNQARRQQTRSETRASHRPSRRRSSWRSAVAVGLLLFLGGLWLVQSFWAAQSPTDGSGRTVVTQQGERSRVQLADGSSVMLNVDSKIRLPSTFSQQKRVVHLTGEAYFEVETDKDRPFIVKTEDASVEVRGTAFNVRGYPDDEEVQVAVTEGGVSFQPSREGDEPKSVELNSGEVGWMTEADTTVRTVMADVNAYIGWTEGRLVFEGTPLPEVARRLERWYNLEFQIRDSTLRSLRLTANLKSQSVENVLDVISASLDIRYKMDRNAVYLMGRESEVQDRFR